MNTTKASKQAHAEQRLKRWKMLLLSMSQRFPPRCCAKRCAPAGKSREYWKHSKYRFILIQHTAQTLFLKISLIISALCSPATILIPASTSHSEFYCKLLFLLCSPEEWKENTLKIIWAMNTVSYGLDIGKYSCCFPKKGDKLTELSEAPMQRPCRAQACPSSSMA